MIDPTKVDILAAIKDLDFDPPKWAPQPCDELDEETIADIDADVTELCRQKFQQLVADYNSLAATATRLAAERDMAQAAALRLWFRSVCQRGVICAMGLGLIVAVWKLTR